VRLVAYGLGVLLFAFVLSYLIWFRRLVLDIPVGLRAALSVLPAFLLYRVATSLYTLYVFRNYPQFLIRTPHAVGFLIAAMGLACLVLFHIWRGVKWDDFRPRKESERVSLLGRSDVPSDERPQNSPEPR